MTFSSDVYEEYSPGLQRVKAGIIKLPILHVKLVSVMNIICDYAITVYKDMHEITSCSQA